MSIKIDGIDQSNGLLKQQGTSRAAGSQDASVSRQGAGKPQESGGETVQLSDRGRLMAQAQVEMEKIPDVDMQKVEALKQSIAEGTYKVDGQKVASKIIQEAIFSVVV